MFVARPGAVVLPKVGATVVVAGVIFKPSKLRVVTGVPAAPVKLGVAKAGAESPNTGFAKEL